MNPVRTLLAFALALALTGCEPNSRSVRAWIESRDPAGAIVAGASVEVDGEFLGVTDQRGLYRLKIRRRVGSTVSITVRQDRAGEPEDSWSGAFTVDSDGSPKGHPGGRIVAVLGDETAESDSP